MEGSPQEVDADPPVAGCEGLPPTAAQLWSSHFRHITTLGIASAGGVLVLTQADLLAVQGFWVSFTAFGLTAFFGLNGEVRVVDQHEEGDGDRRRLRMLRRAALLVLGAGAGSLMAAVLLR